MLTAPPLVDDPLVGTRILLAETWTLLLTTTLDFLRSVQYDHPPMCHQLEDTLAHCLDLLDSHGIELTQEFGLTLRDIRDVGCIYPQLGLAPELLARIDRTTRGLFPHPNHPPQTPPDLA